MILEYHLYFKGAHTDSPGWIVHADTVKERGEWEEFWTFYREGKPVLMVQTNELRLIAIHHPQES